MEKLELIYEQHVLLESKIMNWLRKYAQEIKWIKEHIEVVKEAFLDWAAQYGGVKQIIGGWTGAAVVGGISPTVMAVYFNDFFQKNPETVTYPIELLQKVSYAMAIFINEHPNFLEFLKRISNI